MGLGSSVFIIFFGIVAFLVVSVLWIFLSDVFNTTYNHLTTGPYGVGIYNPFLLQAFSSGVLWFPVIVVFVIAFYWIKNAQRRDNNE